MKKLIKSTVSVVLALMLIFCLAACGQTETPAVSATPTADAQTTPTADAQGSDNQYTGLWANAVYTEDVTLGTGAKTFVTEVSVEDKTVKVTVNTDESTVGAALLAVDLIAGDQSDYGLYVKKVNGITADYDVDKSYWAFYIDGEYAMTGVDSTDIEDGKVYKLEYTK